MSGPSSPADSAPTATPLTLLVMISVRWYNANAAYAVELAQGLAARGHRVSVLVKPGSPVETEARRRGLAVVADQDLTATHPGAVWKALAGLRKLLGKLKPDLVNAHRSEDHLLAALALRGSGTPLVRTRGDIRPPRPTPGNRLLYRRGSAAHVACADFMPERFYPPLGIDPSAIHVIRPGVDPPRIPGDDFLAPPEARRRLGLDLAGPWVGLIGRFTAAKGHTVLLEALARMEGLNPAPQLLMAGVENEISVSDLTELARSLGVEGRVKFMGRLPDVGVGLRALDVLAVPSVSSEAISRIALEGMAREVPVVAARTNSLPEIVGDAGVLVPPDDPEALAHGLSRLLADDTVRAEAARRGSERVRKRYDRATQLDLTEAVFRAVLSGRTRG